MPQLVTILLITDNICDNDYLIAGAPALVCADIAIAHDFRTVAGAGCG
jgi:hypothetical protein